jgi:DNA excision repair protein ERCC-2
MKIYFPYANVRKEQQKLIKDIAEVLNEKNNLLAHAPTGLGKTASSLAPAISFALENKKKIFFLTPKISQHEIVLETIKLMNEKFNLEIKAVDLVGKKALCLDPFLSNVNFGFYEACSKKKKDRKCKFYNNVKARTKKEKIRSVGLKQALLQKYNSSYLETKQDCFVKELCPYELTLEKCKEADVIIADYSHIFDSGIRKNILNSSKTELKDSIIIVDEAHNLSDRIRDMFSISLDLSALQRAQKEAKSVSNFEVEFLLKDIEKEIISLGKTLSLSMNEERIEEIELQKLKKIAKTKISELEECGEVFMTKRRVESCSMMKVLEFLEILLMKKENTLNKIERKSSLSLTILPLDASIFSKQVFDEAYASILMSGTLLPLQMFADILGVEGKMKQYSSPFSKENRLNLFVEKTTTKYTERNQENFEEIASIINKCIPKIPGNSIIFFPSFQILESIAPLINTSRKILKQERELEQEKRTQLIHNFRSLGNGFGGVLLAVSGGSIAEGIDFPGEHLYGAIIVGLPYAKMSLESKAMIDFCQKKFKRGWEYAYNAPAINKAVQAAGRVIRTEEDKGVCVFLDKRFSEKRFEQYYPKDLEIKKTREADKEIEKFFDF